MWTLLCFLLGIFLYLTHTKIEFLKIREGSIKITAEVVEYRKERGPMRNDYTKLNYPYVKIDLEKDDYIISKLRYADNVGKSFKIGQKIDVFWYGSDLLYWDAYDNGFNKYLPHKWNILK